MNKFLYWILVIVAVITAWIAYFIVCFGCGENDSWTVIVLWVVTFGIPIAALFIPH